MAEKRFTIDPANFTDGQWEELYNASLIMPRTYEIRDKAKPFNRPRRYIDLAIHCCLNRCASIADGELGPESHCGEDEEWIADLQGAADILRELIGEPYISRKDARDRLYDLLTSDIYTDAAEYADRVAEVHKLLPIVFRGGANG
jgi:hypothetical protein